MLDKAYIEELRSNVSEGEMNNREAKAALYSYAFSFNVELKKTRSFDNMVKDFDEALKTLADVPMPEDVPGAITTSEVIIKAESIKPQQDVVGEEPEFTLIDPPIEDAQVVEVIDVTYKVPNELRRIEINMSLNEDSPELVPAAVQVPIESNDYELPENFAPAITLIGQTPGFYTLPWWIYDWITKNPDWKQRPNDYERKQELIILLSFIYFIKRDGSVKIRESRNSTFQILK